MGKKRKASSRAHGALHLQDDNDSKLTINTYEDVADSEDEFHINRDRVLLEEAPAAKKLRKWQEEDNITHSDEEILEYDEDDEEEDFAEGYGDAEGEEEEEVVDMAADDGENLGDWGTSKKDYYNADAIETEQDALDEEAEARRLQKKQLQNMTEADFGFDEDEWAASEGEEHAQKKTVVTEVLPQFRITEDMPEVERIKILNARYPEFEHISREYLRLQPVHAELAAAAHAAERLLESISTRSGRSPNYPTSTPIVVTKYRACAAYLASMAMYFAVLGSTAKDDAAAAIALEPSELHDHPVMESLLKCQTLWTKVENLPVADPMVEATDGEELSVINEVSVRSGAELEDLVATRKTTRPKKSRAQRAAELAQAEAQAHREKKLAKTEEDLASLATLSTTIKKATKKRRTIDSKLNLLDAEDSDFGEETELTVHELAEKARKKKSLRFYTSQIAQKANKRDAAGKDYGGDADIPHRERLKDRQARLQAEAEKRGQNKNAGPGVALGDDSASFGEDDPPPRNEDYEDEEGYYDLVAARGKLKRQEKSDRAAVYSLAAKEGSRVIEEEVIGDDGRRLISYQIEKNKGLTPHRKKSVRNPRVKKKEKYKEKQKKLKSMKPVFDKAKSAAGAASYGGELTGIKKGLIRSRKL